MLNPTLTEEGGINRDTRRGVLAWVVWLAGAWFNVFYSFHCFVYGSTYFPNNFCTFQRRILDFVVYFLAVGWRFKDQVIVTV